VHEAKALPILKSIQTQCQHQGQDEGHLCEGSKIRCKCFVGAFWVCRERKGCWSRQGKVSLKFKFEQENHCGPLEILCYLIVATADTAVSLLEIHCGQKPPSLQITQGPPACGFLHSVHTTANKLEFDS